MDKFGRKHSKDPKQESLRTEKDNWNEETSKLIEELIALKRSLNGRSVPEHNLPSSSIKESFPSQVSSHLNHVTDSAAKVINRARGIITQQENYAKTRRRRKKKEASFNMPLKKDASWWGSRFYAKHISFRKLPAKQRFIVIQIMNSMVDLKDKLKLFQDSILMSNKSGIYRSIHLLNSISTFYTRNILLKFKNLENLLKEISSDSSPQPSPREENDETREDPAGRDLQREDGDLSSKEINRRRLLEQTERKETLESLERVKDIILEDSENINFCENLIKNNHPLFVANESLKNEFLNSASVLSNNLKVFLHITKPSKSSIMVIEERTPQRLTNLKKLKDSYIMVVKNFLNFMFKGELEGGKWENVGDEDSFIQIKEVLKRTGTGSEYMPALGVPTFSDMLDNLPLDQIEKKSHFDLNQNNQLIIQASITNYLKEKVLSLSKDNFSILQLAVNNLTKQCMQEIDTSLDNLEKPDSNFITFKSNLDNLTKLLISLVENSLDLGDSYRRHLRISTDYQVVNLADLKNEDLSSLRYQKNNLKNFVVE